MWVFALASKYNEKPKIVERVKLIEVNDTYYDGVRVNGDCALIEPPCWTDFERNTIRLK